MAILPNVLRSRAIAVFSFEASHAIQCYSVRSCLKYGPPYVVVPLENGHSTGKVLSQDAYGGSYFTEGGNGTERNSLSTWLGMHTVRGPLFAPKAFLETREK
jgi:hypothetical protein